MRYDECNLRYYMSNMDKYGNGDPRVLWREPDLQKKRFTKQSELLNFNNKSILDVGCGYGDFYVHLLKCNMNPASYTGIDLVEEHCKVAMKKLPSSINVIHGDFLKVELTRFDISVLSGVLNVYCDNWAQTTVLILDKMWALSKEAIIFNIRSPHSLLDRYEVREQQKKDIDPAIWCRYAHEKTDKYCLHHDYASYDYTVCMWK